MARTTDGTVRQEDSDTALFAHLAYKLEGVKTAGLNGWAKGLKVGVGADALRNAPRHALRLAHTEDPRAVFRPWLQPDWRALDFFLAAVEIRFDRISLAQLKRLEAVEGVVDLSICRREELAIVFVVYERRSDRDAAEARLGDFGAILSWHEVDERRSDGLISTARALAVEAAGREKLAIP